MNVCLLPVPPVMHCATALEEPSGLEMKNQWIAQVLNEVRRVNRAMEQRHWNTKQPDAPTVTASPQ